MVMKLWENPPEIPAGTVIVFSYAEQEDPPIKSSVDKLVSVTSAKPDLRIKKFEVKGEGHHTGVVAAHMRALLLLYEKSQPAH
jgi:hypothetical protein